MFIYIPLGEQVYCSEHGPTDDDLKMIDNGQLDVIRTGVGDRIEYCFGEERIVLYQEVPKGVRVRHIETGEIWTVPETEAKTYQEQGEWVII